jgi:hypothetical protein
MTHHLALRCNAVHSRGEVVNTSLKSDLADAYVGYCRSTVDARRRRTCECEGKTGPAPVACSMALGDTLRSISREATGVQVREEGREKGR